MRYLQVVQKWWWVIILLSGLTVGTGIAISWLVGMEYEARVTVRISTPPTEATLYRQSNRQNIYKEIEQLRLSFNEVLLTDEVIERVLEALPDGPRLANELRKNIIIELPPDTSEFVHVRARAADPEVAALIAKTIVEVGRQQFGQIRAQPQANTRQLIERELDAARAELEVAEAEWRQFQLNKATLQNQVIKYNQLVDRLNRARDAYNLLLEQKVEAQIKEEQMREVGFIQIVSPTPPPTKPISVIDSRLIVYEAVSSVLVGVLVAFFLEHLHLSGAWRSLQPRIKFPTFSPRLGILIILLLIILAIPALVCNLARDRVINEVAQVAKDHQEVQVTKEIILPVKTPTTFSALAPSPAATLIPSADRPVATLAVLPTFHVESYVLSTSTSLPPIPSPTPAPVLGLVTTPDSQKLNVRTGPSVAYEMVSRLENGDEVIILQRTPDGDWLEIKIADQQKGWVASQYIEIVGDIKDIHIAANLAPTPAGSGLLSLNIEGGSVSGQLAPGQEQWYTFFEENEETVLIFMFTPKVGANQVQFFLLDQKQIPVWPPKNPEALAHIGASSYPASDRDGDERTVELVWRGGPLVPGVRYYLRLVNRSDAVIYYCLATRDVFQWSCR
ncbi:MAG: SH3 domain-containing protein [Chloroflexi bacterium]|nr:SH3 domain-containing protein [Chloroflexota bacterium]